MLVHKALVGNRKFPAEKQAKKKFLNRGEDPLNFHTLGEKRHVLNFEDNSRSKTFQLTK